MHVLVLATPAMADPAASKSMSETWHAMCLSLRGIDAWHLGLVLGEHVETLEGGVAPDPHSPVRAARADARAVQTEPHHILTPALHNISNTLAPCIARTSSEKSVSCDVMGAMVTCAALTGSGDRLFRAAGLRSCVPWRGM